MKKTDKNFHLKMRYYWCKKRIKNAEYKLIDDKALLEELTKAMKIKGLFPEPEKEAKK